MMATRADSRWFVEACVFLALLVAVHAAAEEVCDKTKCPGSLAVYKGLGCTPVYKNPGDCCAYRYNCSYLEELSKDKCYVNGHEYSLGEILRPEHRNRCDIPCVCDTTPNNFVAFRCSGQLCGFNCPRGPDVPNCYYRYSHNECCPHLQVCLKNGEERSTCEVDGHVYKDGELFKPESDPENECICMPGYKGENVEPFCKKLNRKLCDPLFADADFIFRYCAPIIYRYSMPKTECNPFYRCQTEDDVVIRNHDSTESPLKTDENDVCRFGNLTMYRGDKLDPGTSFKFNGMKCVCDLPPLLTCTHSFNDDNDDISELTTQNIILQLED